jgi:phage terminase large subunit
VVVRGIQEIEKEVLKEGCRIVYDYGKSNNVNHINYDAIGVGVGVKPHFKLLDPTESIVLTPFDARNKASKDLYQDTHKGCDYFKNRRSEEIMKLKDRFHKTWMARIKGAYINPEELISIDTTNISDEIIDKLRHECTNIREKPLSTHVTIESKDDMKSRGLKSPNLFDSLYICFSPIDRKKVKSNVTLNFAKQWS